MINRSRDSKELFNNWFSTLFILSSICFFCCWRFQILCPKYLIFIYTSRNPFWSVLIFFFFFDISITFQNDHLLMSDRALRYLNLKTRKKVLVASIAHLQFIIITISNTDFTMLVQKLHPNLWLNDSSDQEWTMSWFVRRWA